MRLSVLHDKANFTWQRMLDVWNGWLFRWSLCLWIWPIYWKDIRGVKFDLNVQWDSFGIHVVDTKDNRGRGWPGSRQNSIFPLASRGVVACLLVGDHPTVGHGNPDASPEWNDGTRHWIDRGLWLRRLDRIHCRIRLSVLKGVWNRTADTWWFLKRNTSSNVPAVKNNREWGSFKPPTGA